MPATGAVPVIGQDQLTLIHARYVVPVRPAGLVYEDHAVVLLGDTIHAVLPSHEARARWPQADSVTLAEHVLLPGLINLHTHAPMTLLRGFADDLELDVWLKQHIWPAEQAHVGPRFVEDGTKLAIAEMLRSGTTCFNDMYFFPDTSIDTCLAAGMRASIGITIIEMESAWAENVERYIEKGLDLYRSRRSENLIRFTLSPHSPYTVSDSTLARIADLSAEYDFPVHMHLLETEWEVKQSFHQHDRHPLARLEQHGLMNERLQAVHMTQLRAEDIDTIGDCGAHIVHCPQSNLKLASGICPLASLLDAGIIVALGTDGAASNNDLDLLAESQTAALLAKGMSRDARAVNSFQALEMMTINGARALGQEQHLGSIEPGKQADLCALDLSAPETQPLHNVISQLIYSASRKQVSDVWVAGQRLLKSGDLTTIDLEEVIESAREWQQRLAELNRQPAAELEESVL